VDVTVTQPGKPAHGPDGIAPARHPRGGHLAARRRMGWLFLAPLVAVHVLVVLGPSLAAVYYAFTDWTGIGGAQFIGVDNFTRLLSDPEFWSGLWHNVQWTMFFLTVPMAMGLVGAFLLSRVRRFQLAFRLAYFIPFVLASVVNAAVWQNLLDPDSGLSPTLGLGHIAFFGNPDIALGSVAFVDAWHFWGFLVVLFLASMQSVDRELYEAARMDGAKPWREFWNITLPGIRSTLVFAAILVTIWSFLTFDYVYIITQGGPAGATETAATYLYKEAFTYNEAGYAAAMGLSLSFVSVLCGGAYLLARRLGWRV
jgi:raffinose/stachyose/melibiose transport system permease protein